MSEFQTKFDDAIRLHQSGQINLALDLYQKLAKSERSNPHLLFMLGIALFQIGKHEEAISVLEKSIQLSPNPVTYDSIGVIFLSLKKYNQSITYFNQSIRLDSRYPNAHLNLAAAYNELGIFKESVESCTRAIELDPRSYQAYLNRAVAKHGMKLFVDAILDYNKAFDLNSRNPDALLGIGSASHELGRFADALDFANRAIHLNPKNPMAFYNKGKALYRLGDLSGALVSYNQCKKLGGEIDFLLGTISSIKMKLCDWENFDHDAIELNNKVLSNSAAAQPFALLPIIESAEIQKKSSEYFICKRYPPITKKVKFHESPNTKLRIGYFSADFHDHATMHLMAEIFEKHDKIHFETYGFSFGPITSDQWQIRAKKSFDKFIHCNDMSDIDIAQLSRDFKIDIAVDLKGFTESSRTNVFRENAAPIQVNYLGYPGTMGSSYIDYIIADSFIIPKENRTFFTEKIAYLPDCYQPNCRSRERSFEHFHRSDFGLPENAIVFCSFNANYKITPTIFSSWMKILKTVEHSVLWLIASNTTAEDNLLRQATRLGVESSRLVFSNKIPIEKHLDRIGLADIMLDTYPYGAHTTCSDSLRMGLPIVTRFGETFSSRVAASILKTLGLQELITSSSSAYIDLAIKLATMPGYLKSIKERIISRTQSSSVYDSDTFVKNLEKLYFKMHHIHYAKLPKDHIVI